MNTNQLSKSLVYSLACLMALAPFAIDTYLPSLPDIAKEFSAELHQVEASVAIYMLGYAIGQLFGGPLSDQMGRRLTAVLGCSLFMISSLLLAVSDSIDQLLLFRLIQAVGGGTATVVAAATVRDRFRGREAARVMSLIGMIMMGAPLIAPAVGAGILHFSGWRMIFVALAIYGGIAMTVSLLNLPSVTGRQKASASDQAPADKSKRGLKAALAGYTAVLKNGPARGYILTVGLAFSTMFIFLTESSFIYIVHFEVSPNHFPLLFGANIIVMMLFNRLNMRLLDRYSPHQLLRAGVSLQLTCAILLALSVQSGIINLPLAVGLIMLTIGSLGMVFANGVSCYLEFFPNNAGTANAVMGCSQNIIAATAGSSATLLHDGTLAPVTLLMAATALGAVSAIHLLTRPAVRTCQPKSEA
ncbi:multidrug effflux MFS transporter [Marinobacterium jannaschii]|uniref:multidrug effflux MFS transporter n=1 Tax=Marinobacterium jannaschii TaxID=64970 RepID=UPI0004851BCF|nr:multidrug effflux MFS transporter [Marinobacterium jannaschii]